MIAVLHTGTDKHPLAGTPAGHHLVGVVGPRQSSRKNRNTTTPATSNTMTPVSR